MNTVAKAPKLLRRLARAHNKDARGLTQGRGIKVIKSRGRTIIERAAREDDGYSEGGSIDVVGVAGGLNRVVKHSTWITPASYPTYLRTGETGDEYSDLAPTGFSTGDPGTGAVGDQRAGVDHVAPVGQGGVLRQWRRILGDRQ